MEDKSVNFLSLFASSSTLICCALPAMFIAINIAGRAQQISVEEDANNDKKFTDLSSIN